MSNILLAIRKPRLESLFPFPVSALTKDRKSRGEIYVSGWTIVQLRHVFVRLKCVEWIRVLSVLTWPTSGEERKKGERKRPKKIRMIKFRRKKRKILQLYLIERKIDMSIMYLMVNIYNPRC